MTDGLSSSKCDLTLITSVTPLRSSISWKRIDHKSPPGPCSRSPPVCNAPRHVFRINRNLDVRLLVDPAEDLDSSPKFGSWNRLSAWHLASQETGTQRLGGRCNEKVATPNATCLTALGVSRLPPEPSEAINTLSLALFWNPLLSDNLTPSIL